VETGGTFHYINEKIDDGNIILQVKIDISKNDTAYSLYNKIISLFVSNFHIAFSLLIDGFEGQIQSGTISYYKRELPYGGVRRMSECTYDEAIRFVQAMFFPPFKGACFIDDEGNSVEICSISELEIFKSKFKVLE